MGRSVKLIYYMQKFFIRGDIRHRSTIVRKADVPFGIDDTVQRHPPQLKEIDFLAICSRHGVVGIRQADERNFFLIPILLEDRECVRANRQDLRTVACETSIPITQARQLRAAIRSHKAAQKRKHHGSATKPR